MYGTLVGGIMQSVSYVKIQRWGYFGDVGHALPIVPWGTLQPFNYLNVNSCIYINVNYEGKM